MSQNAEEAPGTNRQGVTKKLSNEPAIVIGALTALVNAGFVLLFTFVPDFSTEQKTAILTFATAAVALLGALLTRSQVTPVSKLAEKLGPNNGVVGQAGERLQLEA